MTGAAQILAALRDATRAAEVKLPSGVPDEAAARARMSQGVPALTGEPLLDGPTMLDGARRVAAALRGTEAERAAAAVVAALERRAAQPAQLDALAEIAIAGAWDLLDGPAARAEADAYAMMTVLDWAARPALRRAAATIRGPLRDARWPRGACPCCGAPPAIAVVRGKEGERHLHCARCGTGWPYERVRCPACGERSHERLGSLHASGEGAFRRVDTCDTCRTYVKTVTALSAPDADQVVELDLATAALDFLAVERGYARATTGNAPPTA